jgi:hypothetical protein
LIYRIRSVTDLAKVPNHVRLFGTSIAGEVDIPRGTVGRSPDRKERRTLQYKTLPVLGLTKAIQESLDGVPLQTESDVFAARAQFIPQALPNGFGAAAGCASAHADSASR